MAVEFFEGFETFTASQISRRYSNSSTGDCSMVTGAYGSGQALHMAGFSSYNYIRIPITSRSEYYFGFNVKVAQWNNDPAITLRTSGGSSLCDIYLDKDGNGTISSSWGASAIGALLDNRWYSVGFHVVIGTSGIFQCKVDGVWAINNNTNTGTTNIGMIELRNTDQTHTFDNVWVFNTLGSHSNNWPMGTITSQPLYPLGDGTYQQWTPNLGLTHYSLVDDLQADDDTTHVYSKNPDEMDTYSIQSLSGTFTQIHAVRADVVVRKDLTVGKTARSLLKSGSSLNESGDITVSTSYTSGGAIFGDDPNTTNQWTSSNVNAIEIGVKTQV